MDPENLTFLVVPPYHGEILPWEAELNVHAATRQMLLQAMAQASGLENSDDGGESPVRRLNAEGLRRAGESLAQSLIAERLQRAPGVPANAQTHGPQRNLTAVYPGRTFGGKARAKVIGAWHKW